MTDQQIADHIEELEKNLLKPEVRSSREKLDELLADDYFEIGASGERYTKDDILDRLSDTTPLVYELTKAEVLFFRDDFVMMVYRLKETDMKTKNVRTTWRTSLWEKRGDKWQMIQHQGTVIDED